MLHFHNNGYVNTLCYVMCTLHVLFFDIFYAYGPEDDPQARLKHVRLTIYDTQQVVAGLCGHSNGVLISVKCVYITNSGILACQGLLHGFKASLIQF